MSLGGPECVCRKFRRCFEKFQKKFHVWVPLGYHIGHLFAVGGQKMPKNGIKWVEKSIKIHKIYIRMVQGIDRDPKMFSEKVSKMF